MIKLSTFIAISIKIIDLIFACLTVTLFIGTLYFKSSRRYPHGPPSVTLGLQNIGSADIGITISSGHLIFLIMTGNAHKQRILPQTITKTFKKLKG